MSRPRLHLTLPDSDVLNARVTLGGKPVFLRDLQIAIEPGKPALVSASFHPEHLEIDIDGGSLRLCGAQLPESVGRALLEQLKALYDVA